uniref:Protein regulator of cytokinesis 1 n=1 Tax=Parastrongyloides trichosuri TaxID=131310 RepID=A0A0N4ZYF0_PARTI
MEGDNGEIKAYRRRLSVVDKSAQIIKYFNDSMSKLATMWDEIEMSQEMRLHRTAKFYETMKDIIDFMVSEETCNYNDVFKDSDIFLSEINETRAALGMEPYEVKNGKPNTIEYCRLLKKEIERLEVERKELMDRQQEAYGTLLNLCFKLNMTVDIKFAEGKLQGPSDWNEMQQKLQDMEGLLESRFAEFSFAKEEILKMKRWMKKPCSVEEVGILETDITDEKFIISQEFLEQVHFHLEETKVDYEEWKEQRVTAFNDAVAELRQIYEKCSVPEYERMFPNDFDPEFTDDKSLERIQDQIEEYNSKYNNFKELYDAFYNWMTAWNDHLIVEADLANPDVYKNRGGCMQQVLTRQKDAERRLKLYIKKLEVNDDPGIKIGGLTLFEKANRIIEDDKKHREEEKRLKIEQRKENLKREAIYGINSPRSLRRPKQTLSMARGSLFNDTGISIITPLQGCASERIHGPKTSSPKSKRLSGVTSSPLRRDPFKTPKKTTQFHKKK